MKTLTVSLKDLEGVDHGTSTAGTNVQVEVRYTSDLVMTDGSIVPAAVKKKGLQGTVQFQVYASDDAAVAPASRGFAIIVTAKGNPTRMGDRPWTSTRTVKVLSNTSSPVALGLLAPAVPTAQYDAGLVKTVNGVAPDASGNIDAGTASVADATTNAAGKVELATATEVATGSDSSRVVTPAALKPLLDAKAGVGHNHDERYYTEDEVDAKIAAVSSTVTAARPVLVRARMAGEVDDTPAMQEACLAVEDVIVPAGRTLTLTKSTSPTGNVSMVRMPAHPVRVRGEDRATSIIKVADGVENFGAIFLPEPIYNTEMDKSGLSNLTFDMNATNNPVVGETSLPSGFGRKVWEHNAGDGFTVEDVTFKDVQSKWLITAASSKVSNVHLRGNIVDGCGSDTYDWDSTLFYLDCRGVSSSTRNIFRNAKAGGARQTMELHGANMTAEGNWQDGWEYGPMFTDSVTIDSGMDNARILNNTVLNASAIVSLWPTYRSTGHGGKDILVAGNVGTLNHGRFASRAETDVMKPFPRRPLAMVELGGEGENRGALDGLVIRDNVVDFYNIVDAAALTDQYTAVISMITVKALRGGRHTRHRYLRNIATNVPTMFLRGYVANPDTEGWTDLVMSGNEAHGIGVAPNTSTLNDKFRVPIYMNGTVEKARVTGNRAYTAAGDPFVRKDPNGTTIPAWSFGTGQTVNGVIDGSGGRSDIKVTD